MQNRVIIENLRPEIDGGKYFIKRVPGEKIQVSADIFGDGHDAVRAALLFKQQSDKQWTEVPMTLLGNDFWTASFTPQKQGFYTYKVEAWIDHLLNWYNGFKKKAADGQDMSVELQMGAQLLVKAAKQYRGNKAKNLKKLARSLEDLNETGFGNALVLSNEFVKVVQTTPLKQFVTTYDNKLRVRVGRPKERFSTWYEFFPRSTSLQAKGHGTFKDCERLLPRVADMGFDVLYFPPIHPIGKINRKGKNNSVTAKKGEPGSPWAIGSDEGGHKAINPALGTMEDYENLIHKAAEYGIEIALDLAFQCAPDHPYIKEHPEWFIWRPDGTIAYAENPPKKYQDIVPLHFETEDWKNLWKELKEVTLFWVRKGVKIFRVDNPHTKPYRFWDWLIAEVQKEHPEVIFLAEAFSRPAVMKALAKGGYSQSYTYFTWRTDKKGMEDYLRELTQTEMREYYRPNFWPNTPDILPYELMGAGEAAFIKRLLLAATLSSNYGMYAPAYEFMENTGADTGKEEYHNSEKYETRHYDWSYRNQLTDVISLVNKIRKENPALQDTYNIHFTGTDNDQIMSYVKLTADKSNIIWCIVNFDVNNTQWAHVEVPKQILGIENVQLKVHDLMTNETYYWFNDWNYIELNPHKCPMHILKVEI